MNQILLIINNEVKKTQKTPIGVVYAGIGTWVAAQRRVRTLYARAAPTLIN